MLSSLHLVPTSPAIHSAARVAAPPLILALARVLSRTPHRLASHVPRAIHTSIPRLQPRLAIPPTSHHPPKIPGYHRPQTTNTHSPFFSSNQPPLGDLPSSTSSWRPPPPSSLDERPVLIIGAGSIGRRVALIWASNSRPVTLYDVSDDALKSATEYMTDNLGEYCAARGTHPGHVCTTSNIRVATTTGRHEGAPPPSCPAEETEIESGSKGPWLAIECLPENLSLKVDVLSLMEGYLPLDCILCSNSSSLMTSEMIKYGETELHYPERLLNTHYFIPPRNRMVEVMSSSKTNSKIFPFLTEQMQEVGLKPMVVPPGVQSPGFIFNRIWAACKRETLEVLSEGVARPEDVDVLFRDFFHAEKGPCERMDEVGLDTVYNVAKHEAERKGNLGSDEALKWLKQNYLDNGMKGEKTGHGLYTREQRQELKEKHRLEKWKEVEETEGA
ncbi:putative mitochondrial precursor of Hydroxyacyl-coenzyme A dehydrogenase [Triangularia verruculosa]|uniref:Mitochondrial of Hydroxyacyl-coenzyme A dehydrogenase n=1 Tax=Triangularia verruculosa TaxID=2587418 RepID=A0AAN6XI04_9PEZI|nr:putative mitochondrial precursor of Hydroxyacyl-coenzyme A dehydrogenase [Triangularia verruculosa]